MKTRITIWFSLTVVALLAFVNNVAVIARWWMAFAEAGGDSSKMPQSCPGIISWLDWSAVDYSAVSTFIPLLGCFCVLRGLVRIWRGKAMPVEHFPFFASADQMNVALGLFGTLWGIIVIGYFRLDKVSMGDLMHCLHTALFSTLIAVVWVFLIDHPIIRPWMRRLLTRANLASNEGAPLADALDVFIARLNAASDAFDTRQRQYEEAHARRAQAFEEAFDRREREWQQAFADREKELQESFARRQREAEERFVQREMEFRKEIDERLAMLKDAADAERSRHGEAEKQLSADLASARSAEKAAEDERRSARASAEEASARATAAESRLEQARSALKGL